MNEYTPATKNVRDSYAGWASVGLGDPANSGFEQKKMEREFDRWLAEHDRLERSKAWFEGRDAGVRQDHNRRTPNPYFNDGDLNHYLNVEGGSR